MIGFMETVPNRILEITRKSILKMSMHYNQPRIVSTQMKLTQKVDHFTMFKSFPNTSCCSQKFPPNNLEKISLLDVRGSIGDAFIGSVEGDRLVGKGYGSKLW